MGHGGVLQRLGLHHVRTAVVAHHGEHVHVLRQLGIERDGQRGDPRTLVLRHGVERLEPAPVHGTRVAARHVGGDEGQAAFLRQVHERRVIGGMVLPQARQRIERRLVDLALQVAVQGGLVVGLDHFGTQHQRPAIGQVLRHLQLQPVRDGIVVQFAEQNHVGFAQHALEAFVGDLLSVAVEECVVRQHLGADESGAEDGQHGQRAHGEAMEGEVRLHGTK